MSRIISRIEKVSKKRKMIFCALVCGVICMICYFAIIYSQLSQNPFFLRKLRIYDKKEELFVFVNHHQTELDALLEEMKEAYEINGEKVVYLSAQRWKSDDLFPNAEELIRKYPIISISINSRDDSNGNQTIAITIRFQQANSFLLADEHWGIYYVETGQPLPYSHPSELEESGGIYYSTYGCVYETENIAGNWYYYRERW